MDTCARAEIGQARRGEPARRMPPARGRSPLRARRARPGRARRAPRRGAGGNADVVTRDAVEPLGLVAQRVLAVRGDVGDQLRGRREGLSRAAVARGTVASSSAGESVRPRRSMSGASVYASAPRGPPPRSPASPASRPNVVQVADAAVFVAHDERSPRSSITSAQAVGPMRKIGMPPRRRRRAPRGPAPRTPAGAHGRDGLDCLEVSRACVGAHSRLHDDLLVRRSMGSCGGVGGRYAGSAAVCDRPRPPAAGRRPDAGSGHRTRRHGAHGAGAAVRRHLGRPWKSCRTAECRARKP